MIIYDYNEYVTSGDQVVLGKWNEATNKIDFQESEEESEVEDEVEDEVYEVLINGKKYYVDNEVAGCIYEVVTKKVMTKKLATRLGPSVIVIEATHSPVLLFLRQ